MPIYRVGPQPGGPFYMPNMLNNREGPQAREPSKCLNESSLLIRDQALSLWSRSTDSKTLDYQRANPRECQIVRTHTKETT